jgi:hypothetical protein
MIYPDLEDAHEYLPWKALFEVVFVLSHCLVFMGRFCSNLAHEACGYWW